MGGMCARVCPTEILCEGACVRETQDQQPVRIRELQRYATESFIESGETFFERAELIGKKIAMERVDSGKEYQNWTNHPNNPMRVEEKQT